MKKGLSLLLIVSAVLSIPVIMISCSGGSSSNGSSSNGSSSSGSVALYVTDSPDEDYKLVELTILDVQLVHTGSGTTCDVLGSPIDDIDLTDIASVLKLVDVKKCRPQNYNRIHIELAEDAMLIDTNNISDTCTLTSYKDENNNPNVLYCTGHICSMDINGAVNVLVNKSSGLALDFDLKNFEVANFNSIPNCTVTMKVSPLNASAVDEYDVEISGTISDLDTDNDLFTLTAASGPFTVSYANVTNQGIEDLLVFAKDKILEVEVKTTNIDFAVSPIDASAIHVKTEGTISYLDDTFTPTFTLTYQTSETITVDYTNAEVEGVLANDVTAEVELEGYNSVNYIAHEVEVE